MVDLNLKVQRSRDLSLPKRKLLSDSSVVSAMYAMTASTIVVKNPHVPLMALPTNNT